MATSIFQKSVSGKVLLGNAHPTITTGADCNGFLGGPLGGDVGGSSFGGGGLNLSLTFIISSLTLGSVTTMKHHGCLLLAEGASRAASRTLMSFSSSTGLLS